MEVSCAAFDGCVYVEPRRRVVAREIERSVMTEAARIVRQTRGSLGGGSLGLIVVARSEDCLPGVTVEDPCWRMGLGRRLPTYPREAAG